MTTSVSAHARLLLWAAASFVLVIAAMLATVLVYQARTGSSAEPVTQDEVDLAQPWWTILGYTLLAPIALAAIASTRLAREAPHARLAPVVTTSWIVIVILCIAYAITWNLSMYVVEESHASSAAAIAAQWLVRGGVVPLAFVATGLLAYQLGSRAVIAVCGVLLVAWVTTALFGVHLPLALLAAVWIPLGVRARRMARTRPGAPVPIAS